MAKKKSAPARATSTARKTKKKKRTREITENERKWGTATHEFGFTYIPNLLLEHQAELELKPIHLNVILTIMKHWWQKDKRAWPSVKTVAESIGRSRNLVQKRIAELEKRGFVTRIPRRDASREKQSLSNEYDFNGLVVALTTIAKRRQREKRSASGTRSR